MDTLLEIGLRNALLATLLALIAWVVGKLARRPALTHVLWVLVLLRLLLPPLWNIGIPRPAWITTPMTAAANESELLPARDVTLPPSSEPDAVVLVSPFVEIDPAKETDRVETPLPETKTEPTIVTTTPTITIATSIPEPAAETGSVTLQSAFVISVQSWPNHCTWQTIAATFWLAGSAIVLGVGFTRVLRFALALRHARPAPVELQQQTEALAKRMGLTRCPGVFLMRGRISPLLWGLLGKPRLILPVQLWQRLDAAQRSALLVHELAHYRRGDHWVRGLEWLASVVFWWHPVLWFARTWLREAEEQCCDAWVIWTLPESRRDYATAIVDTLDFLAERRPVLPALASGVGTVRHLRRRLKMIMQDNTPRRMHRLALVGLLGLGLAVLVLGTTWAQEPRRDDPAPKAKDPPKVETPRGRNPDGDEAQKLQAELQAARAQAEQARQQLEQAMRRLRDLEQKLGSGRPEAVPMPRGGNTPPVVDPRSAPPAGAPGSTPPGVAPPGGTPPAGGYPGTPGAIPPGNNPQPGGTPPAGFVPRGGGGGGQPFPGGLGGGAPGMMPGGPNGGMPGGMGAGMPGTGGMRGGQQNIERRLDNLEKQMQEITRLLQEMRGQRGPGPNAPGAGGPGGGRGDGGRGEGGRGDAPPAPPKRDDEQPRNRD
jgi:beta-lactamase regulating signal transducer with metallopeptidase domain